MEAFVQILSNNELFSAFSREELYSLAEYCEKNWNQKGVSIFSENRPDDAAVYFIQEGVIKIVKGNDDKAKILAIFGSGNIFGEMSFLDSEPRSASAVADTAVILFKLTPEKFANWSIQNPRAAMKLFRLFINKLVKRLRQTDEALISFSNKIITT
jgi:CRP-like cAMP-binding protein